MKPWLIQRATKRDNPNKTGIDALLDLDYMGSSEFEWGAVPKSLKRLRGAYRDQAYTTVTVIVGNDTDDPTSITVFGPAKKIPEIAAVVVGLSKNQFQLKEYCCLCEYGKPLLARSDYARDFWWDIDHDWMCWVQDESFERKFIEAVESRLEEHA